MKPHESYQAVSLESSVLSASPVELVVMTYDRILVNIASIRKEIVEGKEGFEPCEKAFDLIQLGLMSALDFERGGEIAKNLAALYDWGVRELMRARSEKSLDVLDGVIEAYSSVADAWREILRRQQTGEQGRFAEGAGAGRTLVSG